MRNSFGPSLAQPATVKQAFAESVRSGAGRLLRPMILVFFTAAAVLVCSVHAAVAGADTARAAGFGYLCLALVMFGCALAFWTRARVARGALRIRWWLITVGALAASIGYAPSFTQEILHTPAARLLQTVCFNTSEALYMLAAVLFFASVARSILIVDALQALLFVVMRFNAMYSSVDYDHFNIHHLLIGQFMALFLFLVAIVASRGAATRAEANFLRTLSWFFGLRLIAYFLANQVSYIWLHYAHSSVWDVPGEALLTGFSLYMLYTSPRAQSEAADTAPLSSSVTVRSLVPSFLALVNLMLGLFLLRTSVTLAVVAISVSLVCYVARTVLSQAQSMKDKAVLQSRNEQLEHLAIRDPLTGIGNRRSLAEAYGHLQTVVGDECLALLLTDIDYFKQANDSHGHLHGDKVLIALARRLESLAAGVAGSHCARLGGDEFALLLPGAAAQRASSIAEELRLIFSAHKFETGDDGVSLSVGIASLEAARDLPLETLVCRADEALYRAKELGRNRVEVQPVWEPGTAAGSAAQGARLRLQRTAS
jgi:diguanylate cyclase (GGDEF)-like protein